MKRLAAKLRELPGEMPAALATVDRTQWVEGARTAREDGHRMAALWGADHRAQGRGFTVHAAYAMKTGLAVLALPLSADDPSYPDVSSLFPVARRMQRATFDLLGIVAEGAEDTRPWLRHGAWREGEFPLRRDFDAGAFRQNAQERYPFVRVEGDGVHEIPVGPIHAGIIEPGHFRFSVVGEKVLRLEERLGYTHKGIEKRFEDFTVADGYKLAGRISGDSTVAYAWAYCQAAEAACGIAPPPRARWLRALLLESERIANHLGDLGALGNDAGFGLALAQFMRLKEDWLRLSDALYGHRFARDCVVPGGVTIDIDGAQAEDLVRRVNLIAGEVRALREIFDEHSGMQDRFITTGRVTPELARSLGLTGLAGRASGQPADLRVDFPVEPYDTLAVRRVVHEAGDVAARVKVRFEELLESLRLAVAIANGLPPGDRIAALPTPQPGAFGIGRVEGWRGESFVAVEAGEAGRIARCHAHDPSWQNWPLVEHAIMGNIVPDFPLINKSFNLSYSGHDL
ncbi:MAG: NADH-quinone oxidoreductase subunit C [Betaproteobacteria bacterium]